MPDFIESLPQFPRERSNELPPHWVAKTWALRVGFLALVAALLAAAPCICPYLWYFGPAGLAVLAAYALGIYFLILFAASRNDKSCR
jgi:hypothetical protein